MPDDAIARPVAVQRGLLRFLTCGSVDDGKSTLIGRLLFNAELVLVDQMEALERESRSEEHTSELQSPCNLVCRLLLEKKKKTHKNIHGFKLVSYRLHTQQDHYQIEYTHY